MNSDPLPDSLRDAPDLARTSGRSMAPLVLNDSMVSLRRTGADDISPGDIILFRRDDRLLAHRLIDKRGHGAAAELREKGDNCLRGTWIPATALLGRAVELRHEQETRRLDVDTRLRRIRWLTALSRWEADAVEGYLAVKARGGPCIAMKWILLPFAALAAPVRFAVLRLLLTAYPRLARPESVGALRSVIRLFRSLFAPQMDPAAGDGVADDWQAFCEMAGAHGLLPLAAQAPPSALPPAIPSRALAQIRKQQYRVAFNHTRALQVVRDVGTALDAAGVPYAVLKGPFLYEELYRDLFPRDYDDIDILVPRRLVDRALTALRSAGYAPPDRRWSQALLWFGHFHFGLHSADGRIPIELHWSMVDRGNLYRIPGEECFTRLRRVGTDGAAFSVLCPEDEFIYLCLHAAKHGALNFIGLRQRREAEWFCRPITGNRLLWYADIALFLRRHADAFDWAALRARLFDWNVAEDVRDCLRVMDLVAPESPARSALTRLFGAGSTPQPAAREPAPPATRQGPGGRQRATDRFLNWSMRMNRVLLLRPIRVLLIGRLLLPGPERLMACYGCRSRWRLPWLYLRHPFHVARRLLGLCA